VTPPLLELVSVSKTYPGVQALDRVSLRVERGSGSIITSFVLLSPARGERLGEGVARGFRSPLT